MVNQNKCCLSKGWQWAVSPFCQLGGMTKMFLCSDNIHLGSCCFVSSTGLLTPAASWREHSWHAVNAPRGWRAVNALPGRLQWMHWTVCRSCYFVSGACAWLQGILWAGLFQAVVWAAEHGQPCDAEGQAAAPLLPVQPMCVQKLWSGGCPGAQLFLLSLIFAGIWNSGAEAAE